MISFKLKIGVFTGGGDERTGGSRQQQLLKMLVGSGSGGSVHDCCVAQAKGPRPPYVPTRSVPAVPTHGSRGVPTISLAGTGSYVVCTTRVLTNLPACPHGVVGW